MITIKWLSEVTVVIQAQDHVRETFVSFDDENAVRNVSLSDLLSAIEHAFMNKDSISRPYNSKKILHMSIHHY